MPSLGYERSERPTGGSISRASSHETAIGRRYLHLLRRASEVATPRRESELRAEIERGLEQPVEDWRRRGSMAYARA